MKYRKYTDEQKEKLLAAIAKKIEEGMTKELAVAAMKLSASTYYQWTKPKVNPTTVTVYDEDAPKPHGNLGKAKRHRITQPTVVVLVPIDKLSQVLAVIQ